MRPKLNFMVTTINTVFGEESTRPLMKSTPSLLWSMEVNLWCFGVVWAAVAQGIWSNLMARWMQHVIRKYWRTICTHQPESCTWDTLGLSNMTIIQNTRPGRPATGYSRKKWRFWSGHHSLLTLISLSHFGEISGVQFMQDSPRIYRNWRLFAKKNGHFYHLRK